MKWSEQLGIDKLAEALAKAQGEMHGAAKDRANPYFKSQYATLASVREAIREPFTKYGLSVTQPITRTDDGVKITTLLLHSSGQWISEEFDVPASKLDAQGLGSAATYGMRYSLQAIAGVAPDDASDDDGNHATGKQDDTSGDDKRPYTKPEKKPAKSEGPAFTPEQEKYIADVKLRIINAKNQEELKVIGGELPSQSKDVRDHLRPIYAARSKVLPTSKEQAYIDDAIQNIADCPDDDAFAALAAAIESQSEIVQQALKPHLEKRGAQGFPASV
jgi:hypothetical protein